MAIIATLDASARVVRSALVGEPGAFEVVDPITLSVDSRAGIVGDAFTERTGHGAPIGILFLEVPSRRRYRVNGTVIGADEGRIFVRVAEAYANCPKYIQRRALHLTDDRAVFADIREGVDLDSEQQELIASADTFFIASAGPDRNLDASHRGGRPGFVELSDGDRLLIPDYAGNNMYNTLGNLSVNPTTGLLFIDFDTGDTLQLSGVADIDLEAFDTGTGGPTGRDVQDDLVDMLAAGRTVARRVAGDVTAQSVSPRRAVADSTTSSTESGGSSDVERPGQIRDVVACRRTCPETRARWRSFAIHRVSPVSRDPRRRPPSQGCHASPAGCVRSLMRLPE